MEKLLTSAQMRTADRRAIEELGLPGIVLMENAGAGAASVLMSRLPNWREKPVLILAGAGNNGGDGFVIARRLLQEKGRVRVLLFGHGDALTGDARVNHQVFLRLGGQVREVTDAGGIAGLDSLLAHAGVVVDALFGTGLARPVTGHIATVIEAINRANRPLLAVDLPSGVCTDTGRVLGCAIRADWTVTFAAEKLGHRLYPGAGLCGAITVVPIGIPDAFLNDPGHDVAKNDLTDLTMPPRLPDAHKGQCGRLLILAGSLGMEGAAILTALGALRTGPGLVTVATPLVAQPVVCAGAVEAMTLALPNDKKNTHLGNGAAETILASGVPFQAMALGPGLGANRWNLPTLQVLIGRLDVPAVLDADALNALAGRGDDIRDMTTARTQPLILTPHPGEMARLLQASVAEVQADRLGVARRAATEWQCWLVLKGANTIIAAPDGRAWINLTGNAGLAAGGSGDLLTGIIAGLLAQGWPAESATRAGVWLHGAAADAAASTGGMAGMVASDLLPHIRRLRNEMDR
ncbi:MAG: NAD(P)H-hydrate dehydratase [Magnetococcales bacterium]|nr:NAD(P)H-hydrate dehydratase [Magnetococcales bacterium]